MIKALFYGRRIELYFILLTAVAAVSPTVSFGGDSVCAQVKIEIKQELTLERQAFDAHLRIRNGLDHITLENIRVEVLFTGTDGKPVPASSDPDNTNALFFIRLDSMDNIDDVNGNGTVAPSTTADIHWLIIPSPGSSKNIESGALYYVGAKLSYRIGGEEKATEVTPDYIFVKPMPEMVLDYFLPGEVYGDDSFTAEIEPPVPFSMGVRIHNNGRGVAKNLKIDTAQPVIVENEQGLLVGFSIKESEVNGKVAADSLLVDFGDIAPETAATARWDMSCTLSGKFVEFTAGFSHSDELGGELTSLISDARTHFLIHDVLVDLPDRDTVRDFLTKDADTHRVYESDAADTEVMDQSASGILRIIANTGHLSLPPTTGFIYAGLDDPFEGQKSIKDVIRSDGKVIKTENVWKSRTRSENHGWGYFINLFDADTTGSYTIRFAEANDLPLPPVLQTIADKSVSEGERVTFTVKAGDPNGSIPMLSAAPLPAGADFIDEATGAGLFDWTPAEGQAGTYEIIFVASDGIFKDIRRMTITVRGFSDVDGDYLDDDWEMQHFGTLERDGSGDFDRDGISDRDEFLNETDPASRADLQIRQNADTVDPQVGDRVIFILTAINNGPKDADGIQAFDILPSGLLYLSDDSGGTYNPATGVWDIGRLSAEAPDNTVSIHIVAQVVQEGQILNVAAVTESELYDPQGANNSAGLMLNAAVQSDLAVSQTVDNASAATGDTIDILVTVTNNGLDDATGVIIEHLHAEELTHGNSTASQGEYDPVTGLWDVGNLSVGDSAALQLGLIAQNTSEIINTAAISHSDQLDPDRTNNRSSLVINQDLDNHLFTADIAVYKAVSQNRKNIGDRIMSTLLIRNNGPADATDVKINEDLSEDLTYISSKVSQGIYDTESGIWQVGAIPSAHYAILDTIAQVTGAGEQMNSASLAYLDEFDPDIGNDSDNSNVTGLAADIAVTQTADTDRPNVGETVLLAITATNTGPDDATGVEFSETLAAGMSYQSSEASHGFYEPNSGRWTVGNLAAFDFATLQIRVKIEQPGEISARTTITSSSPTDINPENDSGQVIVLANARPVAGDIPDQSIDEGEVILFSGSAVDIDSDSLTYYWDFSYNSTFEADAGGIDLIVPSWIFGEDGLYTVALRVEDDDGGISDVVTGQITVNDLGPGAAFSWSPQPAAEGSLIEFTDVSTSHPDSIVAWRWEFGDGHTSDERHPRKRFSDNGTYTVRLTVIDDDGSVDSAARVIRIDNSAPKVDAGSDRTVDEGDSVSFAGSYTDPGSDTHTLKWEFGDGTTVEGILNPVHTYPDNGRYIVTLTVTDDDGGTGTDSLTVSVNNLAPTVEAGPDQVAEEGDPISFIGRYADPGVFDGHTLQWDFGDGTPPLAGSLASTHTYGDNGIYTVTLRVADNDGKVGTDTLSVRVHNAQPVITGLINDSPSNGEIHFEGVFSDKGWLDVHSGTFKFGDGTTVAARVEEENDKPGAIGAAYATHNFQEEGIYSVSLSVADDDGTGSEWKAAEVLIDKTPPGITVIEPKAGYYYNTGDIKIQFEIEDPVVNGVSSGLVAGSVVVALDDLIVANGQTIDLSGLEEGVHTINVKASDHVANWSEAEVVFEVEPVPAIADIKPHQWSLSRLNPFADFDGNNSRDSISHKESVTAYINLDNVEVETILPTFSAAMLKVGNGYGDFVVVDVVAAQPVTFHEPDRIRSLTLQYMGTDEIDILAFSGETIRDFYGVNEGGLITIDAGEVNHLGDHTILSYYIAKRPFYSSADIIPETILLNGKVPILDGSAKLIIKDPSQFDLPGVIAQPPFTVAQQGSHHVWLTDLGDPALITLEVGDHTVFADLPYPINWHGGIHSDGDGILQIIGLLTSKQHEDMLRVFYQNLTEEARIYFDGKLAFTILPNVELVSLEVSFDWFEAISSIPREDLMRGGDWQIMTYAGVQPLKTDSNKHVTIAIPGSPQKAMLVIGEKVIFKDEPMPIRWADRGFSVDGELQDMSIFTSDRFPQDQQLSIQSRSLTREAKLYLDGELVLRISPSPEVQVRITGALELDGDSSTFDGSFLSTDTIELTGELPDNFDPNRVYQRINISGIPGLEIGDRFGDFEVAGFSEEYDGYRITGLEFRYDRRKQGEVKIYGDPGLENLIEHYNVNPGDTFSIDVGSLKADRIYFEVGNRQRAIRLTGEKAPGVGDRYLGCTVIEAYETPVGPPHYIDLTLEYTGSIEPISITGYDGQWESVIGTYVVDPYVDPVFMIDGSERPGGFIGENLLLEY